MELKKYKTKVKNDHKIYGQNEYVLGRISGLQYAYCGGDPKIGYAVMRGEEKTIFTAECSEEQYERFKTVVEEMYPGLCEFDV